MRAPASSLRSLARIRSGVVRPSSRPSSDRPSRRSGSPTPAGSASRWGTALSYLLPLLLVAALTACDGAAPTEPVPSGVTVPARTWRGEGTGRPNHLVQSARARP